MSLNHSNIIKHKIHLYDITHPSDIYQWFKKNKFRQYAYKFEHTIMNTVLKYGESAEMGRDRDHGERVRRQAENLPGWGKVYRSPSGKDMDCIVDDYFEETGILLSKNDVSFTIYDFKNHIVKPWRTLESEIRIFEAEKIDEHLANFGRTPIGNLREEKHQLERTATDATLGTLFVW